MLVNYIIFIYSLTLKTQYPHFSNHYTNFSKFLMTSSRLLYFLFILFTIFFLYLLLFSLSFNCRSLQYRTKFYSNNTEIAVKCDYI